MLIRLFLLFTVVPLVELFLLIQMGVHVGPWWTMALVLATGLLGAWLARREGFAVLRQVRGDLLKGIPPANRLVEAVLVLAGALLLVTPGICTDITGILLLFPPSRRWIAPRVLRWLLRRFEIDVTLAGKPVDVGPPRWSAPRSEPGGDGVEGPENAPRSRTPFDHPVR